MTSTGPRTIRILIVEDSVDQAMFLRGMLESTGWYDVDWAQDGARAVQLFGEQEYDVVLTDLNLPGMDGFDLTREIKRTSTVPVIAVTGYTHQSYFESAYRAGADALVQKPVERDELVGRLREFLPELHPARSEGVRVFALEALPGDAIGGCGGALLRHIDEGAEVLIFLLSPGDAAQLEAGRAAADRLGARIIVGPDEPTDDDAMVERQLLLERVIREFDPHFAYVPSLGDDRPVRREAHRLSRVAVNGVKTVMAYATGSTTLEFRPTTFRDIAQVVPRKVAALDHFARFGADRPDLSLRFAQAQARYWGRFAGFGEVEPFEVLSS